VLAFSPDGKVLLVSGTAGVRLLDAATGNETRRLGEARGSTRSVTFSPDGKQIAVTDDGGATFYEAATGMEQRRISRAGSWTWWLAYAPDGRCVALPGATTKEIRLCDAATGEEIRGISNRSDVLTVAFAPDGKTLAVAGRDHAVRLWDVATGKEVRAFAH